MSTPASIVMSRLRAAAIALAAVAAVVAALGWPRDLTCDDDTICDGTSGSWVAVGVGGALALAAFAVFVLWAAAVGTRLGNRADREADTSPET